jgi:hypothetical protein
MIRRLSHLAHPRPIASAAIIAACLCALGVGHALGQPRPAPSTPRHAATTIAPPLTSVGGQIAPSIAPPTSGQPAGHAGDGGDGGDVDHQGGDDGGDGGD